MSGIDPVASGPLTPPPSYAGRMQPASTSDQGYTLLPLIGDRAGPSTPRSLGRVEEEEHEDEPDEKPTTYPWGAQRSIHQSSQTSRDQSDFAYLSATQNNHRGKRGGRRVWLLFATSSILLAAALFSLIAQAPTPDGYPRFIFRVEAFSGAWVNSSNVSALLTAVGSGLAAVYSLALIFVGRMWLLSRARAGRSVKVGQLTAIASMGQLNNVDSGALSIGHGVFAFCLAATLYIPTAFSGALTPRLHDVQEPVRNESTLVSSALAGSMAAGERLPAANDCFAGTCPARTYFGDIYRAMDRVLAGTGGYYESWGIFQNATLPVPVQKGLVDLWKGVPDNRLEYYSDLVSSEGCVPIVQPNITCRVAPSSYITVTGNQISFDSPCGRQTSGNASLAVGGFYTSFCSVEAEDTCLLYQTLVDEAGRPTQIACNISVSEAQRQIAFFTGLQMFLLDQGPCGNETHRLSMTELRPLVSSAAYVLSSVAATNVESSTTPLMDAVAEAINTLDTASLERMLGAGINTAATVLYVQGVAQSINTQPIDGWIHYQAYTWAGGFKGYFWSTLLLIAGLIGLAVSLTSLLKPRLRYDPTDLAQTTFLCLSSPQPALDGGVRSFRRRSLDLSDGAEPNEAMHLRVR